jgi:hypothetical protein
LLKCGVMITSKQLLKEKGQKYCPLLALLKKNYVYFTESLSALPAVNFGTFAAEIVII